MSIAAPRVRLALRVRLAFASVRLKKTTPVLQAIIPILGIDVGFESLWYNALTFSESITVHISFFCLKVE